MGFFHVELPTFGLDIDLRLWTCGILIKRIEKARIKFHINNTGLFPHNRLTFRTEPNFPHNEIFNLQECKLLDRIGVAATTATQRPDQAPRPHFSACPCTCKLVFPSFKCKLWRRCIALATALPVLHIPLFHLRWKFCYSKQQQIPSSFTRWWWC